MAHFWPIFGPKILQIYLNHNVLCLVHSHHSSTGVAEGEIVDFNSELACTDEDTRPRCVTAGGSAKETLRSQAGKDISAGGQQAIINPASTASKSCAAGEDCEIVDFNAELPCTDEDIATARGGCIPMRGSAGASTGGTGSSPERP